MASEFDLRHGGTIPAVGFGMYLVPPKHAEQTANTALEVGYRHIDTAAYYRNEGEVGSAVWSSGLDRGEVFVTSKVWPDNSHRGDRVGTAIQAALTAMQFDYVDLYLIHWPADSDRENLRMWESMLRARDVGLAKHVGVSNFGAPDLDVLFRSGMDMPEVNQLEVHPAMQNVSAVRASEQHGVLVQSWGPLGQGRIDYASTVVGEIAQRHERTWAQVLLRWQLQRGRVVLPKSMRRERMIENLNVDGFTLTDDELALIDHTSAWR